MFREVAGGEKSVLVCSAGEGTELQGKLNRGARQARSEDEVWASSLAN